jgi:hypothetical protein
MDFAMDLGKLSFSSVRSDSSSNGNELRYETGDFNIKLSGIKDNNFLVSYLSLFDTSGINAFRQYLIDLKYDDVVIFKGFINPDNIDQGYEPSPNIEIIEIQILGIEKEFKRYYSYKTLPDQVDIFNDNTYRMPWSYDPRTEDNNYARSSPLFEVLGMLFDNKTNMSITLMMNELWFMNNIPQFYNWDGITSNWFLKSGYKRWTQMGLTVYDLLEKICNAMGFVWKIQNGYGTREFAFIMTYRSMFYLDTQEIDFNKIMNYKIGYQIQKTDFEYIIIPEGYIKSGTFYSTQGKTFKMISNKLNPVNQSNFFLNFSGDANGYSLWPYPPNSTRYCYENAQAQDLLDYAEIWYTGNVRWNQRASERKFIKSDRILVLDAGLHEDHRTVVCARTGHNYPANDTGEDETDIVYSGNCGSMLFTFRYNQVGYYIDMDYNSYSQSQRFKNNFISFLAGGNNQTLEVEISDLVLSPYNNIKFLNSNKSFFDNSNFAINELDIDLIQETSKLLLVRNN